MSLSKFAYSTFYCPKCGEDLRTEDSETSYVDDGIVEVYDHMYCPACRKDWDYYTFFEGYRMKIFDGDVLVYDSDGVDKMSRSIKAREPARKPLAKRTARRASR